MTQREQGRDPKSNGGEDRDEDKQHRREPRPSDRERDEDEDEDKRPMRERAADLDDDRDDDDEGDGERGQSADGERRELTDEEKEERRLRRRQEKKDKRERERRERQADKETIRALREKTTELEQRLNRGETAGRAQRIEDDLAEADQAIRTLRGMRKKAIEDVNPDAIDEIEEKLYRARRRKEQLADEQEALKRRPAERVADSELIRHANRFMRDHDWYDPKPNTDDEDSLIVQSIDRKLHREGDFDPNSPAYWDEFRDRLKKHPRLKHRFGGKRQSDEDDEDRDGDRGDRNERRERGGPPVSGRGNGRGDGAGGFTLTEEHKHALREAGIEPGTARYAAMIDKFKKAHKAQREARQG